jgi:probable rRNA maturation factor
MLVLRNRQRLRRIDSRLLKQIIAAALAELDASPNSEICFHLIAAAEMTHINWQFLQHEGSTDVITFDHAEGRAGSPLPAVGAHGVSRPTVHGEIFICLDDAVAQAKQFRTTWQSELVRYAVHGILHLLGHEDLKPAARQKMKRVENRLVRRLAKQFPLARLAR